MSKKVIESEKRQLEVDCLAQNMSVRCVRGCMCGFVRLCARLCVYVTRCVLMLAFACVEIDDFLLFSFVRVSESSAQETVACVFL